MARRHHTLDGVAMIALLTTGLSVVIFVILWIVRDENKPRTIGIPGDLAEQLIAAYLPAVTATVVGFREWIGKKIRPGQRMADPITLAPEAWRYMAAMVLVGQVVAILIMVVVSVGIDQAKASKLIVAGGAIWAGTLGFLFERYFKELPPEGSPNRP